jgi:hypothetical protein
MMKSMVCSQARRVAMTTAPADAEGEQRDGRTVLVGKDAEAVAGRRAQTTLRSTEHQHVPEREATHASAEARELGDAVADDQADDDRGDDA